jgi:ferredoxin
MHSSAFAGPLSLRSRGGHVRLDKRELVTHRQVRCRSCRSGRIVLHCQMVAESAAGDSDVAAFDKVTVRFINTPGGEDILVDAKQGENLLRVGDAVGVHIPRGCRSGLCGACTSDVVDNNAVGGVQIVRACQTGVALPHGYAELIVDVHRISEVADSKASEPMARFDDMDTGYVAGAPPRRKGAKRKTDCAACSATGDITCYYCGGLGAVPEDTSQDCQLCVGTGMLRCAKCQGVGTVMV